MINVLHGLGLRMLSLGVTTPFLHIGLAHNYATVADVIPVLQNIGESMNRYKLPRVIAPLTFSFTGSGNVSQVLYHWWNMGDVLWRHWEGTQWGIFEIVILLVGNGNWNKLLPWRNDTLNTFIHFSTEPNFISYNWSFLDVFISLFG